MVTIGNYAWWFLVGGWMSMAVAATTDVAGGNSPATITHTDPGELQSIKFEDESSDVDHLPLAEDNLNHQPLRFDQEGSLSSLDSGTFMDKGNQGFFPDDTSASIQPNRVKVTFQDDNGIVSQDDQYLGIESDLSSGHHDQHLVQRPGQHPGQNGSKKKKRRRRRRKPRQYPGFPQHQGFPQQQSYPQQQDFSQPTLGLPGQITITDPQYPISQYYRPSRRPTPNVVSNALSTVSGALSSIARYDDAQCVSLLLCQAAGGTSAGAAGDALQSVTGLQSLLTLLMAYSALSTSPLFVFGRAALLGVSSRDPLACRAAYPLCPADPEQLVHYLNNHNGGFFRFFSAPLQGPQNLQQFYNQLSVPGKYGLHSSNQQQQYNPEQFYQSPGLFNQYPPVSPINHEAQYGLHAQGVQPPLGHYPPGPQHYGLIINAPHHTQYTPNLYEGAQQYGYRFLYQRGKYGFGKGNSDDKSIKIEKRIQNFKSEALVDNSFTKKNSKWLFPEETGLASDYDKNNKRIGKHLKFPFVYNYNTHTQADIETNVEDNRRAKGFLFPGTQSNRQLTPNDYQEPVGAVLFNSYPAHGIKDNKLAESLNCNDANDAEEVETVYVVRGDGDPNHPEIIRVKKGQILKHGN